jgi:Uma2 family endonuclease
MVEREAGAMVTSISERPVSTTVEGDQCVTLHGIDWKGYGTMLRLRGERPVPKIVYLDGSLLLVSPSYIHECLAERLGLFVVVVLEELEIQGKMAGSTTFRRRKKSGGVEGDKAFYLGNLARVIGKRKLDLRNDPPPDLAIEVVHTHDATAAVEVHRRLGVPEVWVCDENELQILARQDGGRYARSESSPAFPYLNATEVFEQVSRHIEMSDIDWVKELRRWVRETLVPRRAATRS